MRKQDRDNQMEDINLCTPESSSDGEKYADAHSRIQDNEIEQIHILERQKGKMESEKR